MAVFLLAGGFGKRIRAVDDSVPKPLIQVAGRPVIFRQIDQLLDRGLGEIVVIGGYKIEILDAAVKKEFGSQVRVIAEPRPLGTGGCLSLVRPYLSDVNLVISGDLVFDFDVERLLTFHSRMGAELTLTTHPNSHPFDSDLIEADSFTNRVSAIYTRPHPPEFRYSNLVNASIAVVNRRVWDLISDDTELNFEKDLVKSCLARQWPVYSYRTSEYIADMGTPDRFTRAQEALSSGAASARSLRKAQKAVFIDRDGVLNVYRDHIVSPDQITLETGVIEGLKELNRSDYLAIVVTNQPAAAKGLCSMTDIEEINKELETQLGNAGAKLDDIFICPHHPESGFVGEVKELKIDCDCRKPRTGMFLAAAEKYHIDLKASFLVGDTTSDILAGQQAGIKTILVETGLAGKDCKYKVAEDYRAHNFLTAIRLILSGKTL